MLRYFCDRCGGPIEDGKMYWMKAEVRIRKLLFSRVLSERGQEYSHQICTDCQQQFLDWWNEGRGKEKCQN